jgi:Protein of unknown function (DUF1579)
MDEIDKNFGKPNPNASAALSQFAFLIGRWRCEATITLANGESQKYEAAWIGRYILDGYVIADDYGMAGETIVLGMNFRAYDSARQQWNIKWLNALTGTWTDLGPEELGGVRFDGQSIVYAFKEPQAAHAYTHATYTRATYTNISASHFTWRGEKSGDGKAWTAFMVIEAFRVAD